MKNLQTKTLQKNIWLVTAILLLLPTIFFPFSGDHSIFMLGAEAIDNGKKLYIDFIDLKPPFFYYLFWAISKIFSTSEIGMRIFDFLMQTSVIIILFRVILWQSKNQLFAGLAAVIYAILYTSFGYNQTLQGESFGALILIVIIAIQLKDNKNKWHRISIGILIGIVTAIKYPMGIILIVILIDDLFSADISFKKWFQQSIILISIFAFTFILTLFPLLDGEVFTGFLYITDILSKYSARPPFDAHYIKMALEQTSIIFGNNFSFFISGTAFTAIFLYFHQDVSTKDENKLIRLSILSFFFLFFSIAVEKKYHLYYFLRMLPVIVILSASVITLLYTMLIKSWGKYSAYSKFLIVLSLIALPIYSPLMRYAVRLQTAKLYLTNENAYEQKFEFAQITHHRVQWKQVADFVNAQHHQLKPEPLFLNVQTGSSMISYWTPNFNQSVFQNSQFYISAEAPILWQKKFYIEVQQADIICFEKDDFHPYIYGHNKTSYEYFFKGKNNSFARQVRLYVYRNFEQVYKSKDYIVFMRKFDE